ncbi:MAG TPA: response regulator transcription factor [Ilumatobacter sp.]|jgi:DNA-binding NarL/FixJ family response regulator|nr:response regulator transcription factor [Ilumatobacter sp.]
MTLGPIRVAIVDDHPIFRLGLAATIGEMNGIELVGEAERAGAVSDLIDDTAPLVVLLDVRLPDGNGLDVNRWLHDHHPCVKVVMLTMSEELETVETALRDGAAGYLVKGASADTVENAIRTAAAGAVTIDPTMLPKLIPPNDVRPKQSRRPLPQVTDREFEVLDLIARGMDNTSIARELYLEPKTVRNHVSSIFSKLHVRDRAEVIVLARRNGLGGGPDPDRPV